MKLKEYIGTFGIVAGVAVAYSAILDIPIWIAIIIAIIATI